MKFKYISILVLSTLFILGCSKEVEKEVGPSEISRTIVHDMGTTVIYGTPKRIVTLYQGATDGAIALGITPVGIVQSWSVNPIYEYLADDLTDSILVGLETQPNLEEIAKLQPDLIIASTVRHEKIYEQLSQIAPTVAHETVYKFKETVELMAEALGEEDKAISILSSWDTRVKDLNSKLSNEFSDKWPVDVSVLNFRTDHARIYVTGFAGDILKELGFTRSEVQQKSADAGNVVIKLTTKESIPSMDGDVFFIFNADGHNANAAAINKTFEDWTQHPLWTNLKAVKNGTDYIVDEVAWNMGGGILAANIMLDQIYDRFNLEY